MNHKYRFHKYTPDFKSQVIELQTHLWSPDLTLNSKYLEWKYELNPYIKTPLIYIALLSDNVIGMRGFYGAKWHFGRNKRPITVLCAGDLVITPEHRNRGIFTGLMTNALNDLSRLRNKYLFNLSASPITLIGSLAMGWRSVGSLQTMCWLSKSHSKWNYSRKRFFLSSDEKYHPFHFLDMYISKNLHEISPYLTIDKSPKPEEMAELVERINNNDRIRHVRDQQFFSWRFQNPISQYRFLYWKNKKLEGYLVLQTSVYTDNVCRVSIVDFEATSERVYKHLLLATLQLGKFGFITIWTSTLKEEINSLLKSLGFKILKKKMGVADARPTVLVGATNSGMLNEEWVLFNLRLLDLKNWDIRMIFSDTY